MTQITTPSPVSPAPGPQDAHGKAWVWPAIVIALLSLQIVICLVAYLVATGDPSQVVISNYHTKALEWDKYMAEQRAGDALGWQAELDVALEADMFGDRTVRLSMKDAGGEPLTGASIRVRAFHYARADQAVESELKEAAPGEYLAALNMRKAGRWELSFVVSRGEDTAPFTIRQQVGADNWSPR